MAKATKKLSNSYSTGGGGYQFESHVQAAFVILMLTDGHPPCFPNKKIIQIKLQAKSEGHELDDMVVFLIDRDTKEEFKLLVQIKHAIGITERDPTFAEVINACWADINNPKVFNKTKDKLALITGPISAADIANTRTILDWAYAGGKDHDKYFQKVAKAYVSSKEKQRKLKAFESNLKKANGGALISQSDFFEFLQHFNLLGYDLDIKNGVTYSLLQSHIAQYYPSDVSGVWAQVVLHVQDMNKKSGCITLDDIPDDIKKYFKQPNLSHIPQNYVKAEIVSSSNFSPSSKLALTVANIFGGWNESSKADTEIIRRFIDGI
jgi:hypothetical protein